MIWHPSLEGRWQTFPGHQQIFMIFIDGIYRLMHSEVSIQTNIGNPEYETVDELVNVVAKLAGKKIKIKHVDEQSVFSNEKINKTGWKAKYKLYDGIKVTYLWIVILSQIHQLITLLIIGD